MKLTSLSSVNLGGDLVTRKEIQQCLEWAATREGVPAHRMGSHSLRIGGATALYHTTSDLNFVRRFGRWASDAFHGYLWEAHEKSCGVSSSMVQEGFNLVT